MDETEPTGLAPVTRAEFEKLCLVVELILAAPNGILTMTGMMGWEAKGILEDFAKMRMKPPIFSARIDGDADGP
jgi:hypothetical protein